MATLVSDNFTRADDPTSLGIATTGQVWSNASGVFGISSNQALWTWNFGGASGNAVIDSGATDGITQVDLENPNDTATSFAITCGLIFRYVNSSYFWRLSYTRFGTGSTLNLQRTYGGSTATVLSVPVVLNNGDTIKAAYCGSNIEIFINGVSQGTYDDSLNPQNYGTFCGLIGTPGSYFSTILRKFDNFLVTTNGTCTPTYNCTMAGCVDPGDGSGTYATLAECLAACSVAVSYNCINGSCIDPGDGSGVFTTLLECQQSGCGNSGHTAETEVFDAGTGSPYYLTAQVTDSGDELRSKVVKSIRTTGIRTNVTGMVLGYDVNDPIDVADLENGTRSNKRMMTGPQSFSDSTSVTQSERKPVNVKNAVLWTVRIEGDDSGQAERDQIHEVVCEVAKEGIRR